MRKRPLTQAEKNFAATVRAATRRQTVVCGKDNRPRDAQTGAFVGDMNAALRRAAGRTPDTDNGGAGDAHN